MVTHRGNRRLPSTYGELAELSARCAHAFDQHGLQPGDRVLLWGNNSVEWAAAFFGCILRGIVAVPLDATGSLDLARRVLAEVQPKLLAGDLELLELLQTLDSEIPVLGFSKFAAELPQPHYTPLPALSRDTVLQIIFTSGTTAEPKGIVHTHGNVLASLDPLEKEIGKYLRYERFVHPLRILHTLPLSHVFGQFMGLWVPPLLVAEVHYEDRLQAARLAGLMHKERISVLAAVPRVLDLLRSHVETVFPGLSRTVAAARGQSIVKRWWRCRALHRRLGWKFWAFVAGGASLPADLEVFWTTAGFALIQGYGMTETTALVTLNHPFKIARGSIGKPLAGREVKIGDDGEILVRGDSIASQVWQHGQLQAREQGVRDSGWLATGDLATRDADGQWMFVGRKSDVIVTSAGVNIHPQDLEAVLLRQPELRDALVVEYDSIAGPTPAAVLLSEAPEGTLEHALKSANRELAGFQQIRYWLRWPRPEFPRTSTGKVLRRAVQSWAQQSLTAGGTAVTEPADRLVDTLRQLGAPNRELAASDRLAEDLHLDSLAMVQLQTALETAFGVELDDTAWEQVRTVGDLRTLLHREPIAVARPTPEIPATGPAPSRSFPLGVSRQPKEPIDIDRHTDRPVFPRWPAWGIVRLARVLWLEAVTRPLVWLLLGPRAGPRVALARPSLLIANHLTAFDVPVILYALSGGDRHHVAVAMSGELLTGWRRGKAERHQVVSLFTPLAYGLVTALFNVFPLLRRGALRQSFAHAGEALDRGEHVLVFPEGRRSKDGRLQPFEPGIGLLAQQSEVPVQPIYLTGLRLRAGNRWPKRGTVTVRLGTPLTMAAGEEPQAFTRRLEAAVAALEMQAS